MGRGAVTSEELPELASGNRAIRIRPASQADIPELATLKRAVAAKTYGQAHSGPALERWLEEHCGESFFRYRIGRKDYYLFVAEDAAGEIVGVSGYRQRGSRADGSSVGLYVLQPGKGIGGLLNDAREQHARSLGCTRARVACWRSNENARAFVESQGYKRTGAAYREAATGVMVDQFERDL